MTGRLQQRIEKLELAGTGAGLTLEVVVYASYGDEQALETMRAVAVAYRAGRLRGYQARFYGLLLAAAASAERGTSTRH